MKWPTKLIVFITFCIVAVSAINTYGPEEQYDFSAIDHVTVAAAMTPTVEPLDVSVISWRKFGTAQAKLKLHNPNKLPVIDPIITCVYYGASKTPITSTKVKVYQEIPGGKTIKTGYITIGFAPDQAKSLSCYLR